jgi:pimeloyl-ACP methyl ester carboxylesterase
MARVGAAHPDCAGIGNRKLAIFVLVHGAWHGGWCWRQVAPLLRSAGHEVYTPSLTGLGERRHLARPDIDLDTHIEDVVGLLEMEDLKEVVLVGHSYGGMVVTGVAERMPERIQHLVYLDAFLPADGQSLFDMGGPKRPADDWRVPQLQRTEDLSDPEVQWNNARRLPHPRATLDEKISLTAPLESRPFSLTYIVATERPDPGPVFDRIAADLRGNPRWTVREISGGHGMIRTNPDGLVALFLELFPSREPVGVKA